MSFRVCSHRPARVSGFTLLELLVVILIIGLLTGIVAPRFLSQIARSETTTARAQIDSFDKALQAYRIDMGRFPSEAEGLRGLVADNAFADVGGIVRGAVAEDPDLVYGLFLSAERVPWVFVAPGVDRDATPDPDAWKVLRIDEASLAKKERQVRHLELFGQEPLKEIDRNVVVFFTGQCHQAVDLVGHVNLLVEREFHSVFRCREN